MIINNSVSTDDYGDRRGRLLLLSKNIDEYAVELGLSVEMLEWSKDAHDRSSGIEVGSGIETAEAGGAYSTLHAELRETYKYYNAAKGLLKAIIKEAGINDDIKESYGIIGKTSRSRKGLTNAIETLKNTHDKLKSEGDTRVLPDVFVDNLVLRREKIIELWYKALDEKKEAKEARELRNRIFNEDTRRLAHLFSLCKMKWGIDDNRLHALGFLPKRAIWTFKHKDENPENTEIDTGGGNGASG